MLFENNIYNHLAVLNWFKSVSLRACILSSNPRISSNAMWILFDDWCILNFVCVRSFRKTLTWDRLSHCRWERKKISLKKYILKNFAIFPGKNLCWSQCFHIFQLFSVSCNIWCQNLKSTELTPWTQDVLKQSEDVQDVFWTSFQPTFTCSKLTIETL